MKKTVLEYIMTGVQTQRRFPPYEKPRLTKHGTRWTCSCSRYEGYGFTPLNAWRAWNDRDIRVERKLR